MRVTDAGRPPQTRPKSLGCRSVLPSGSHPMAHGASKGRVHLLQRAQLVH